MDFDPNMDHSGIMLTLSVLNDQHKCISSKVLSNSH